MKLDVLVRAMVMALTLSAGGTALAQKNTLSAPVPGNLDARIITYAYTPDVVYRLPVTVGMHTQISMGADEEIAEQPIISDKVRWLVEGNERNLYVKALQPGVRASLSLVTTKRTYQFELEATESASQRVQLVKFSYPDTEAAFAMRERRVQEAEQAVAQARADHLREQSLSDSSFDPASVTFYRVDTEQENFRRMHAYSDGVKTWMRMPPGIQDLPAVFMVDEGGRLMPVNYTVADRQNPRDRDVIIIERTAVRWMLRIGRSVEVRLTQEP